MVLLTLYINTQTAHWPDYEQVIKGGQIIRAQGVINTRHEEFSALGFAREAGLHGVLWDALQDDTAGSIELSVLFYQSTLEEITARVSDPYVQNALEDYDLTEIVERHTAETHC